MQFTNPQVEAPEIKKVSSGKLQWEQYAVKAFETDS
jgi:hypothetical protein